MWIDTHCHLDAAEFDADRDAVREAARQLGVARCVIPAVHRPHWDEVTQLAKQHGDAYALGIHPLYVPQAQGDDLQALDQALTSAEVTPGWWRWARSGWTFLCPPCAPPTCVNASGRFIWRSFNWRKSTACR